VPWNTSINGYTVALPFLYLYISPFSLPVCTVFCIMGSRVSADPSSTSCTNPCFSWGSYTPNSQCCLARSWWPRLCFAHTSKDSSIWTILPGPPSEIGSCRSCLL